MSDLEALRAEVAAALGPRVDRVSVVVRDLGALITVIVAAGGKRYGVHHDDTASTIAALRRWLDAL